MLVIFVAKGKMPMKLKDLILQHDSTSFARRMRIKQSIFGDCLRWYSYVLYAVMDEPSLYPM